MRIAFFVVMLLVAVISAMDIVFGDSSHRKTDTPSIADTLGIKPVRRRPESVYVFLIATVSMAVVLIVEVLV